MLNRRWKETFRLLILLPLLILCHCGGPSHFIHPQANLGLIRNVAVIPFDNLTNDQTAGEKVYDIFVTELLNKRLFFVVEYGEVARVLREKGIDATKGVSKYQARIIGESLKVEGIILGTVNVYDRISSGALAYPVVNFSSRLVETRSGLIVWKADAQGNGLTIPFRLFGVGGKELTEVTNEVTDSILGSLRPRQFPLIKPIRWVAKPFKYPYTASKKIIKKTGELVTKPFKAAGKIFRRGKGEVRKEEKKEKKSKEGR